ncbi:MAG: HAD-IA family hydrolase [Actinomycetota bacterium]
MTVPSVRAICWDVGGVFTGSPHDAVAAVAADLGLTHAELSGAVFGDLAGAGDHPWHDLERGRLSLREAWTRIGHHLDDLGVELSMRELFSRMGADPHDRTVVHDTVRACADAGLGQAIVTNNVREFSDLGDGRGWQRMVPMECMAVVVDSSAVGMRKPDAEIYRHVLAELGVDAAEAVLVDDTAVNLEGAASVGMQTVLVGSDPAPAMAELRRLALS